ncbi:PKD domain-containing protein [Actinophytocola oryzae]|uniref:PKD domain-containing protein n=1 Tax=Actinophytocola oryzae TaxID=502181 RepID=UPI0010635E7C|nr:PKD domain-containing protein [Actinophytocola oryzae]
MVYTEDFENGTGNTGVRVTDYTGAPPVNATYQADPAWLANCDGWVLNAAAPDPAGSGCNGRWFSLQGMAATLGAYAGNGQGNHALGEESAFVPVGADKVVVETASPIPLSGTSRFLTFSVDVTEVGCAGAHSLLKFYLMDGATAIPTFSSPIEACVNPPQTIDGVPVGTYTSNGPVLFAGSAMGLRLVNGQGAFAGNDFSIDNIRVLDVTPQLDRTFGPTTVPQGGATTLTYTLTNTDELAVKNGWSFTDAMPAGLSVVPGSASTNCSGGSVSATAGTVSVAGNLAAGQTSCSATVSVTAGAPGTYQSCGANVTAVTGVSRPGCATVTFNAAPSADAGGPYSGQEGAPVAIAGAVSDADGPNTTVSWTVVPGAGVDAGATCVVDDPADPTTSVRCTDDGAYTLTLTASDGLNPPVAVSTTLTLFNQAPTVEITAPDSGITVAAGSTVDITADFADPGANDTHTCTVDFDDGSPVANGTIGAGTCAASHGFTVPGAHNVLVTVFDDDGASATDVVTVNVDAPPAVEPGGPYSGTEGGAIGLTGVVTDTAQDLTHTWAITPASGVDAGATCAIADADALATTLTCTDDGTYTLTLTADDGLNEPVTASTAVTVANAVPVVTITAPDNGVVVPAGSTVDVSADLADAGANDTHTCAVDFGDANPVANGTLDGDTCVASHVFTASGTHTVTVTVTDDDGGAGTDTVQVVVNSAPVVDAGGPYSGQEGTPIAIAGEVTDPDGPNLAHTWQVTPGGDIDAGATCDLADAGAVATTVTCTDDGTYTLTLTGDDGLNDPVAVTTTLTLFNQAPAVEITTPPDGVVVALGAVVPLTAPFADPGANDTHTCTVDFDDGTPVVDGAVDDDTCTASHGFTVPGTHNVLVTVFDDDGASATDVVAVVVNAPPVVDAGGPYSGQEGAAIAVTGEVTDPDGPDLTTTWTVEPGAGVDGGTTCAVGDTVTTTVTCTDNGTFTLRLTADDGVNAPVTATATLTVANVAPVVTITAPAEGALFERGDEVAVTAQYTDAGANDTHTCAVDFGDGTAPVAGTVAGGTCAAAHAFTVLGPHTITVTVTDDDGGAGTDTVQVVVFVTGEAWAVGAGGPVTIAKTPHAVCPPDATLTQVGLNVPAVVNLGTLNAACTVSPTTGVTRATASVANASLLGGVISISTIESTCLAGPTGLTGSSEVGTINGKPIGGGSGSITIPLVATVYYNQTVTTPTGELFQYAIRVRTLLGQEIILAGCRVG